MKKKEKYEKKERCLHEKHRTPESRVGSRGHCSSFFYLRAMGFLANKCVDCGKDIRNLELLKEGF